MELSPDTVPPITATSPRLPHTFGKKRFFVLLSVLLLAIGIPVTLFLVNTQQDTRSRASSSGALRWAPPTLQNPTTITITSTGPTTTKMDTNKDYIILLPKTKKSGMTKLEGGRNVVMIGGHLTVAPNLPVCYHPNCTHERNRAVFITGATGTVHIEGTLVDSSSGSEMDAFIIAAPDATVQIQNVRINNLRGTYKEYHADMIQAWGGVKELRIDRLTGDTNYQGFYFVYSSIKKVIMQNVNIKHNGGEGKLMYMAGGCGSHPGSISFSNVYFQPRPGRSLMNELYPDSGAPSECRAQQSGNQVTWAASWVTGGIIQGVPATDFVAQGIPGINYVSPGYGSGPVTPFPTTPVTPQPSITKPATQTPKPTVPSSTVTLPLPTTKTSTTPSPLPTLPAGQGFITAKIVLPGITDNKVSASTMPKEAMIALYNAGNIKTNELSGILERNAADGSFRLTVPTGSLAEGSYTGTLSVKKYLGKRIPGILRISRGQTLTLPDLTLVAGDINNDNTLNILDWTLLISCYEGESGMLPGCKSDLNKKEDADLTGDSVINLHDLNLFLRSLSTLKGD